MSRDVTGYVLQGIFIGVLFTQVTAARGQVEPRPSLALREGKITLVNGNKLTVTEGQRQATIRLAGVTLPSNPANDAERAELAGVKKKLVGLRVRVEIDPDLKAVRTAGTPAYLTGPDGTLLNADLIASGLAEPADETLFLHAAAMRDAAERGLLIRAAAIVESAKSAAARIRRDEDEARAAMLAEIPAGRASRARPAQSGLPPTDVRKKMQRQDDENARAVAATLPKQRIVEYPNYRASEGDLAALYLDGDGRVPLASDGPGYEAMSRALAGGDPAGVAHEIRDGRATLVTSRTPIRVLGLVEGSGPTHARVRLGEGPSKGREGFVPLAYLAAIHRRREIRCGDPNRTDRMLMIGDRVRLDPEVRTFKGTLLATVDSLREFRDALKVGDSATLTGLRDAKELRTVPVRSFGTIIELADDAVRVLVDPVGVDPGVRGWVSAEDLMLQPDR